MTNYVTKNFYFKIFFWNKSLWKFLIGLIIKCSVLKSKSVFRIDLFVWNRITFDSNNSTFLILQLRFKRTSSVGISRTWTLSVSSESNSKFAFY